LNLASLRSERCSGASAAGGNGLVVLLLMRDQPVMALQ